MAITTSSTFSVTLFLLTLISGQEQECSQPTEGISFTFHACFKYTTHGPLEILWTRNGRGISRCTLKDGCLDYWEDETRTSMVLLKDGTCQSNITIHNVTEKECGMWRLNYLGPSVMEHPDNLFICEFSKADSLQFNSNDIVNKKKSELIHYVFLSFGLSAVLVLLTAFCIFRKRVAVHEMIKKTICMKMNEKSAKNVECSYVSVTDVEIQKV